MKNSSKEKKKSPEVETNLVSITGELVEEFKYSHTVKEVSVYSTIVRVERASGISDYLDIVSSEQVLSGRRFSPKQLVTLVGQFRSYNNDYGTIGGEKNKDKKLILAIWTESIQEIDNSLRRKTPHSNLITVEGHLVREPEYRVTPKGKRICDIMIANNRSCRKSSYLPVIIWGNQAIMASNSLTCGSGVSLVGRIQSREYTKRDPQSSEERTLTAYEISVNSLSFIQ